MGADNLIWLVVLVELALLPAVIRLGWIAGQSAYPVARDFYGDAMGFAEETTEAWLLRSAGSFA